MPVLQKPNVFDRRFGNDLTRLAVTQHHTASPSPEHQNYYMQHDNAKILYFVFCILYFEFFILYFVFCIFDLFCKVVPMLR